MSRIGKNYSYLKQREESIDVAHQQANEVNTLVSEIINFNYKATAQQASDLLLWTLCLDESIENSALTVDIMLKRINFFDDLEKKGEVLINWAVLKLEGFDKDFLKRLNVGDIRIISEERIEIGDESITVSQVLIDWDEKFVAIQVPEFLKWRKLSDTYIWELLVRNYSDDWLLPSFLDEPIKEEYIILWKSNAKFPTWKVIANVDIYNPNESLDWVRLGAEKGLNTTNLGYNIILLEILKTLYWEEDFYEFERDARIEDWLVELAREKFWLYYVVESSNYSIINEWKNRFSDVWICGLWGDKGNAYFSSLLNEVRVRKLEEGIRNRYHSFRYSI